VTLTFDLQNLIRSSVWLVNILCQFYQNCSRCSWDIVVTISVEMNKWTNTADWAYSDSPGNKSARNVPSFVYVPGSSPLFFSHDWRPLHFNDITHVIHWSTHLLLQAITTQCIINFLYGQSWLHSALYHVGYGWLGHVFRQDGLLKNTVKGNMTRKPGKHWTHS